MVLRFDGHIAGLGTTGGTRIVVGHWPRSPFGPFTDVMIESPDGVRTLVAPDPDVAAFVAGTYRFDAVTVAPITVHRSGPEWHVAAGALDLAFTVGRRGWPGYLLRAVPSSIATRPGWAALIDAPARWMLPGVRTRGTAGNGRREWYAALDLHRIVSASATLGGRDLGDPAPVRPPVRFGFGSTPARPSLVRVVTMVHDI
jgi:hypothetical protein